MEKLTQTYMDNSEVMDTVELEYVTHLVVSMGAEIGVGKGSITAGECTDQRAEKIKQGIENNLVKVSPDAPSCCIDGRGCAACLNGEKTAPRHSVAGGAPITGYAGEQLAGLFSNDPSSSRVRLERVTHKQEAAGIKAGGHCDEAAVAVDFINPDTQKAKVGCGADEQLPTIVQLPYTDPDTTKALTAALLGARYDDKAMNFAPQAEVSKQNQDWNPADLIDIVGSIGGPARIEVLISDDTPNHGHTEAVVLVIYEENVTLDKAGFQAETGEKAFVINMAYIDKMARAQAGGPHAVDQYVKLLHAMTAYQANTYMTLCDGTQRLVTAA